MRIRVLKTTGDVIEKLGGTVEFGQRYGMSKQDVSNRKVDGATLPPRIYERCKADLLKLRFRASPTLWGIEEPKTARQRAA